MTKNVFLILNFRKKQKNIHSNLSLRKLWQAVAEGINSRVSKS